MRKVIAKGDSISIYSRASALQGWLADSKRSEPQSCSGVALCLGELYRLFGRRITSGLVETASIAAKLMKFHEDFVRRDALQMLEKALEGSGGAGASAAYSEAFRISMRIGVIDKSFIVRLAAARCLRTFASIGGPGLGINELENSINHCVKALEDPVSSVRDAFAEALGALLALAMNPDAQVKQRGRDHSVAAKKLDDVLQRHLVSPFTRATGVRAKNLRIGLTLAWVFFLQVIRLKYHLPDSELHNFSSQIIDMLQENASVDAHALACVLYILRVGITDQMTEPTQRSFLVLLGKKIESAGYSPSVGVATLRILSYLLKTLGEVPVGFRDILDDTVVAALSHSSLHVRMEAALTLRALAEVDPTCVGGLISFGMTTLHAIRECTLKGNDLSTQLDSLHGQAIVLAALVSISPKLLLGYPARLPKAVFEVSKKMLTESSRNPMAAIVEKEAGWLLLASLIGSMPSEELQDQIFDVLLLWADPFLASPESYIRQKLDLTSELRVMATAMEALTAFIKTFVSRTSSSYNSGVLLQPVLAYLSGALSCISSFSAKPLLNIRPALDLFTMRTLIAYQSVPDPMVYKPEHPEILKLCSTPFSDPSGSVESSCLRFLLDKRDACLGPWIPGRDWFEDEFRAFDGGNDGLVPCVWQDDPSSFPQPDPLNKLLVNEKLLFFGTIFATQDNGGMMSLLDKIVQCLKAGKKLSWHAASVTNACVALLAGLKALIALRPQTLGTDILTSMQSIFQAILVDPEACPAQQRASSEGLGLLARLGNDVYTARMMRTLFGELASAADTTNSGCIALSLGCIHRSAGGMALSTLVPSTVSSISALAKGTNASLQLWALHGLLLTIEAAGLSYVSQVQATLYLTIEVLLSDENGVADLRQELGHLINAIVAVLGPELAAGSTFYSRCKSVIAEISSYQETSTLLESVRFTQQLVLFAPQAVSVHVHVQNLLPTLSSRQPSLRHLAVSTLRHLIEKDPVAMIDEKIEENLFSMLNEETDPEIGNLVRATITRLLYTSCPLCPSRWLAIFHNMILATSTRKVAFEKEGTTETGCSTSDGDTSFNYGDDDEDMIASHEADLTQGSVSDSVPGASFRREKHLRYRTRVFAAECLTYLPTAVGTDPAHFDHSLARIKSAKGRASSSDYLVLHLQELVSLAYQISTGPFEGMQPIGVTLLITIVDMFGSIPDADLPGHLLLEQYQAQLVSAVRSAISMSSGPLLLEAGLQLATKIFTSNIISGDPIALNRMFALISRPLTDIRDLCYPSFAEWVACKVKIRLLAAHASIKCYVYRLLREQEGIPDEYRQLLPQFSVCSNILGKYWISVLKDYMYVCLKLNTKFSYSPFLDGIQSPLVSSKVQNCLEESSLVILQATALDAVPVMFETDSIPKSDTQHLSKTTLVSGHSMVKLELWEYQLLWGLALLLFFRCQQLSEMNTPLLQIEKNQYGEPSHEEKNDLASNELWLPVVHSLSEEAFFSNGFLTVDLCRELLQVLIYSDVLADGWNSHVLCLLSQIVHICPDDFFIEEGFTAAAAELFLKCIVVTFHSDGAILPNIISKLSTVAETLACRTKDKKIQMKLILAFLVISCECFRKASSNLHLARAISFLQNITPFLKKRIRAEADNKADDYSDLETILAAEGSMLLFLSQECIRRCHSMENRTSDTNKLLAKILAFCLEETVTLMRFVHETLSCGPGKPNQKFLFGVLDHCTKCVRETLFEANTQVQMVGLHFLKSIAQLEIAEGSHMKNHSFCLFIVGEFFGDVFLLIEKTLKESISRESVSIIEECLRLMLLFHTVSKMSESSQDIMMLLLEAFLMVFSRTSENYSKEIIDVQSIVKGLVSHLVQVPSFAIEIKDAMLTTQGSHRQQLQDMIRVSVAQDQNTFQAKSGGLPDPTVMAIRQPHAPGLPVTLAVKDESEEQVDIVVVDDEDDDDDWDAFQSLPANNTSGSTSDLRENISDIKPVPECETSLLGTDDQYDIQNPIACEDNNDADEIKTSTGKESIPLGEDETKETINIQPSEVFKDAPEKFSDPKHPTEGEGTKHEEAEPEEPSDSHSVAQKAASAECDESCLSRDEEKVNSDEEQIEVLDRQNIEVKGDESEIISDLQNTTDNRTNDEHETEDSSKTQVEEVAPIEPVNLLSTEMERVNPDQDQAEETSGSRSSGVDRDEYVEPSDTHHSGTNEAPTSEGEVSNHQLSR